MFQSRFGRKIKNAAHPPIQIHGFRKTRRCGVSKSPTTIPKPNNAIEYFSCSPIPATTRLLQRAGLSIDDIDLFEINEAFASVVLAWEKEFHPDMTKVNPNGGAIALGHPLGCSGAKLMATMLNELERTGGRYGLQTMCEGGGMANATIIERLG